MQIFIIKSGIHYQSRNIKFDLFKKNQLRLIIVIDYTNMK